MPTATKSLEETGAVRVELAIEIAADKKRVWKALVEESGKWWLRDFLVGGDKTKNFVIETKLGGKAYEDWGDGQGLIWFTITGIHAPNELYMVGHMFPGVCGDLGPATGLLKLSLEEKGKGTILRVQDSLMGRMGDETGAHVSEGWKQLFGQGLKKYVESSRR
ncbi:MAG: SRPBCC domain-containing protein [Elusimicrobia bacterium]|nr:SRPBCC domain-containing protein [Elusimicrobiota bacterium]